MPFNCPECDCECQVIVKNQAYDLIQAKLKIAVELIKNFTVPLLMADFTPEVRRIYMDRIDEALSKLEG